MSSKRYKISSVSGLWDEYIVEVNDKGYISDVQPMIGASITIGSKFESMKAFWEKFEGEMAHKVEELKNEKLD